MKLFLYLKDAWKTIIANKMRSSLSTLGIVIGMASVIIMMSIGEGAKSFMMENMSDLMQNKITIYPGGGDVRWEPEEDQPGAYIKKNTITLETIKYLAHHLPELSGKISYEINGSNSIKKGTKTIYTDYYAVPLNRFKLNEREITEGSLFSPKHYQQLNFVAIVNEKCSEELFKKKSPLGQKIKVENKDFSIIGVLKLTAMEGRRSPCSVYIPGSTFLERIKHTEEL